MKFTSDRLRRYEALVRTTVTLLLLSLPLCLFARIYPDSIHRILDGKILETHFSPYGEGNSVKAIEMRLLLFTIFTAIAAACSFGAARHVIADSRLAHAILVITTATVSLYLGASFLNPGSLLILYLQHSGFSAPRLLGVTYVIICLTLCALLVHFAATARSHHGHNYFRLLLRR